MCFFSQDDILIVMPFIIFLLNVPAVGKFDDLFTIFPPSYSLRWRRAEPWKAEVILILMNIN